MSKLLSVLFLFFFLSTLSAQQNVAKININGKIIDSQTGEALNQATVRVQILPDSVMLGGGVTNQDGFFEIPVLRTGNLIVNISYMGYTGIIKQFTLKRGETSYNFGVIKMEESARLLKEAVVQGQVPPVVVKEDTIEYNVDSYKMQANSVVEDMLKKLPGVDIDSEGKITANGKEIKKVYVDGKEFFGNDPTVATKNINTDIVEKLQVIDKKSDLAQLTGIDDGDDETVINLTIKKGMKKGWMGNILGGYGYAEEHPDRFEASTMINRFEQENQYSILGGANNINNQTFTDRGGGIFSGSNMRGSRSSGGAGSGISTAGSAGANLNVGKSNDFRVGGNLFFSAKEQDENQDIYRENILQDSSTYYNSNTIGYNRSRNFSSDLKMEWQVDSLTKVELQPSFGYNKTYTNEHSEFLTSDELVEMADWRDYDGDYVNKGTNHREMDMEGANYSMRANISRKSASKPGRRVSLSLTVNGNNTDGESFTDNKVDYDAKGAYKKDTTILVNQRQLEESNQIGGRVYLTWVEPFGNNRFLQLSYNANGSNTKSERNTYLYDAENETYYSNYTDSLSDHIENRSLTHSIGASIRTVRDRYNYNIGLNVDPSTRKSTDLLDDSRSYKQSVVNYAPVAEFNYLWNKRKSLRIQYRGRTSQPTINQLQPSKNNSNPLFVNMGNMDLKPSYTNNFSMRFSNFNQETLSTMQASLQGSYNVNSITNKVTYDRETGVQTSMPVNVNGAWNANGRLMFNKPLGKRFQINSNTNATYRKQVGFIRGNADQDAAKNISNNYSLRENFSVSYRSDLFDLSLRGNYMWSKTDNTVSKTSNQTVQDYGATVNLSVYMPWSIVLNSDYTYNGMSGYAAAFGKSENLWNAKVTKTILNKKGTLYVKVNDILQDKKTITRRVSASSIQDIRTDQLTSYAMVGFSYRFATMGANNRSSNRNGNNRAGYGRDFEGGEGRGFGGSGRGGFGGDRF